MAYKPPPAKTKCKNCGESIVLQDTYYTHERTGRLHCDPAHSSLQAEPK